MANLKLDLLNKINNKKYFEEMELVRLAQDPNMNYERKIDSITSILGSIALLNVQLGGIESYFQEPAPQPQGQQVQQAPAPQEAPAPQVQQAPAGQVHQGQTHGE
jgi:hypothetical protein